jgi:hypothetical protein
MQCNECGISARNCAICSSSIALRDPYIISEIAYILLYVLPAAKYELEEEAHLTGGTYIPLLTASDDRPEGGSVSADKYVLQT